MFSLVWSYVTKHNDLGQYLKLNKYRDLPAGTYTRANA